MRRIPADHALDHPLRQQLFNAVLEGRLGNASALARAFQVSRAAARHHLALLEEAGHLASRRLGRQRVYAATSDPVIALGLSLLATPACLALALDLQAHPGASAREAAARAGLSRRVVHHHAKRLREAGLVAVEGSPFRFTATPRLRELLAFR